MKKNYLLLTAAIVIGLVSCNKEIELKVTGEEPGTCTEEQLKEMTFIANTDLGDTETRTVLDGSNDHIINWAADETIYVFDGTAPRSFTNGSNTGSTNVPFTGSALVTSKYYALFPSGFFVKGVGAPTIKATIPVTQNATANSFDPTANVSIAVSDDIDGLSTLSFKNVGSVLKLSLGTSEVRKVIITSRNSQCMTGEISITLGAGDVPSIEVTNGVNYVILDGGASNLSADTPYYITVAPGSYSAGFNVKLVNAAGKYRSFSNTNSQTLTRSSMMDLGSFTGTKDWKSSTIEDEIVLSDTGRDKESYADWSSSVSKNSTAVYFGNSAKKSDADAIQLKASSAAGIITTTSGGYAKKVTVDWNSGTAATRKIYVYGKNTAYTATSDLWDDSYKGTLIGSIDHNKSETELSITSDYSYIGIVANGGAVYLNSISFEWDVVPSGITVSPSVSITGKTPSSGALNELEQDASFIINSNKHWFLAATFTPAAESANITYESAPAGEGKTQITVHFPEYTEDPGTSRSVSFTVTPEEGGPISPVSFTQTVREQLAKPSTPSFVNKTATSISVSCSTVANADTYEWYVNGVKRAETGTTPTFTGLSASTDYSIQVKAVDSSEAYLDSPLSDALDVTTPAAATLSSIALTTAPTKTVYYLGEDFDFSGAVVTATYTGGAPSADVTASCTTDGATQVASAGAKTVTISYTEGGNTRTTTFDITVKMVYTLTFPDDNSASNGLTSNQYTSTWTATMGGKSWSISNFNNNNWGSSWTYIKCGRKKPKSGTAESVATITTSASLPEKIKYLDITIDAIAADYVNSFKVYVATNSTFTEGVQSFDVTQSTGIKTVTITTPTAACYYKIEVDCQQHPSSNGFVQISKISYKQE